MNIDRLKQLSLQPVNEPVVEYILEVDVETVEVMNDLIAELNAKNIAEEFVKEHLTFTGDTNSPMSKLMLSILGGVAEVERSLIRERQRPRRRFEKGEDWSR